MKLELLYFEGCPSYERLLPRLEALVDQVSVDARVELRRVESPEAAAAERFLGSPTVRVDGHDVERRADARTDYGRDALDADPGALAGDVMEPGPSTVRADLGGPTLRTRLERDLHTAIVTTPDGVLLGVVRRDDLAG